MSCEKVLRHDWFKCILAGKLGSRKRKLRGSTVKFFMTICTNSLRDAYRFLSPPSTKFLSIFRPHRLLKEEFYNIYSIYVGLTLCLSTKRSNCHFNFATFCLPWVWSAHCPSKNFFLLFDADSLDRQHSEWSPWQTKGSAIEMTAVYYLR